MTWTGWTWTLLILELFGNGFKIKMGKNLHHLALLYDILNIWEFPAFSNISFFEGFHYILALIRMTWTINEVVLLTRKVSRLPRSRDTSGIYNKYSRQVRTMNNCGSHNFLSPPVTVLWSRKGSREVLKVKTKLHR